MSRPVQYVVLIVYCFAVYAVLDFTYSSLWFKDDKRQLRVYSPIYNHALAANFDGFDLWGEYRHKMYTNNLGFKDIAVRDIPLNAESRRVILIGDSFTEGLGLAFENTFAGMLYRAGRKRADKIEFLNASSVSYSPTIYYAKIKDLLDRGLRFDEVVVFIDMSDIRDEAVSYFCVDDIPEYRARCKGPDRLQSKKQGFGAWLQRKFTVTNALRVIIKYKLRTWFGQADDILVHSRLDGWALPGWNAGNDFGVLGIEGGITRARRHMQKLADLLKQNGIALTVAVYPYAAQLADNNRNSRQIDIWREFCATNCKAFINLFPAFFAAKDAHPSDWYQRYFIFGDIHYSADGNRVIFNALAKHLL